MEDPPNLLQRLFEGHARLKARIHSARFPIKSKAGLFAMGCVYFVTPVIGGYFLMDWATSVARKNLGANGEKLLESKARWEAEGRRRDV
jgi:hypothetical protein